MGLIESLISSINTLQITYNLQGSRDGTLSVRSVKENSEDDSTQYRGISYRRFERKFTMADDIIVNDAGLENGMLTIDLERVVPEEKKPRLISVK